MKIFVANFDRKTRGSELEELFSEYGRVQEATIAFNWKTEEQEEWGFVEIPDNDDAERAIRKLNGRCWNGRRLKVSKARSRE